eukprot:226019-Chlamydomonas_euryale.AAC.1
MLLPMQRNNNVGVMLANLKMPPAQVRMCGCMGGGRGQTMADEHGVECEWRVHHKQCAFCWLCQWVLGGAGPGDVFSASRLWSIRVPRPHLFSPLFPRQVVESIHALVTLGESDRLSEEQVDAIAKSLATADEKKVLGRYTGPVEELCEAEQLLIGLMQVWSEGRALGGLRKCGAAGLKHVWGWVCSG